MPPLKKKPRLEGEIPTSSMADIAFLLLIFFLVTTTIDVDTGIGMVLPPKLEEDVEPPPIKERNVLKILVNETGMVLLEDAPSAASLVREEVKKHVLNNGVDPAYAEAPGKALISIKTARETPYNAYVEVLDEVWMAFFEMWDSASRQLGYADYSSYVEAIRAQGGENEVRDGLKPAISIAEPDDA